MKYIQHIDNKRFNCEIVISLDDDCGNGHEDFAITGTFWEIGKSRIDRNMITAGCCHDEILKVDATYKQFINLHLSDYKGAPTHPIANGFYYRNDLETFQRYLRLTESEAQQFSKAENENHLYLILTVNGIVDRWQEEAKKAIKRLETLTGEAFESSATGGHLKELTAEQKKLELERLASGYYSPELVEARKKKAESKERTRMVKELEETAKRDIEKINNELAVELEMLRILGSVENAIYYDHTNTLKLNWLDSERIWTEEDRQLLIDSMDFERLPQGLKIEMKE